MVVEFGKDIQITDVQSNKVRIYTDIMIIDTIFNGILQYMFCVYTHTICVCIAYILYVC